MTASSAALSRNQAKERLAARRRGLTLIEVLVSLAIGSVVVGAVVGVLEASRRASDQGETRADLLQSVRVALSRMESDLRVACYRSGDEQFEFIGTDVTENDLPQDTIEFSSAAGSPLNSLLPTGDLLRVSYFINLGADAEQRGLVRQAMSLPLPEDIPPEQEELAARSYCPAALGLDVTYYDPLQQTWIEEWQEQATPPSAVQIVLYVLPELLAEDETDLDTLTPESALAFSTIVHLVIGGTALGTGQPTTSGQGQTPGLEGGEPTEAGEPGGSPEGTLLPGLPGFSGGLPQLPAELQGGGAQ